MFKITSWKPEVKTVGDDTWNGNALRFARRQDALDWAADLAQRWTAVTDYRATSSSDPVNQTPLCD